MSYKITKKIDLDSMDYLVEVEAPEVAERFIPGQFVMLMTHEQGERVPMSVMKAEDGKITMFIRKLGKTSKNLRDNFDTFYNVIGPLGNGIEIKKYGTIVVVSDAVCGQAENYAFCQALSKVEGNNIISMQTFPNHKEIYPEDVLTKEHVNTHIITTEDGSYGEPGSYLDVLQKMVEEDGLKVDYVLGGGKLPTLKKLSAFLKKHEIPNELTVRQMMVDGSGMCGACRLYVNGEMKLACIDGPMFDGRYVDWDTAIKRYGMFKREERVADLDYQCQQKGGCQSWQK